MIRDLGRDFPSAERWDELELKWLDFIWVGGGRQLLIAGASKSGLHLFWLGPSGFLKSAFYLTDAFPDPVVRVNGDRITLVFRHEASDRHAELLWWGP